MHRPNVQQARGNKNGEKCRISDQLQEINMNGNIDTITEKSEPSPV